MIATRHVPHARLAALLTGTLALVGCRSLTPSAGPGSAGTPGARPVATRQIRVTVFGDSNSDGGTDSLGRWTVWAYISPESASSFRGTVRLRATDPQGRDQLTGLIETRAVDRGFTGGWTVSAINHSMSGSGLGPGGSFPGSGPAALDTAMGHTRFQAEVLGQAGTTWNPGRTFGRTDVPRVSAYVPDADSYVYIALGTNNPRGESPAAQAGYLSELVGQWVAAGHSAGRVFIATVPPGRTTPDPYARDLSLAILALPERYPGLRIVDISGQFSAGGERLLWESSACYRSAANDPLHYTLPVRRWIADQVVGQIAADYPRRHGQ